MSHTWLNRVEAYLKDVEETVSKIDNAIQKMRLETGEMRAAEVQNSNAALMESLSELEEKIAQREQLLRSEDAPDRGVTLTEKIERSGFVESHRIAERCRRVSELISTVNQRAVSLFVCQFHLSQLSGEIVRLLAGQASPSTYHDPQLAERNQELGGGLFNEAA